MHLCLYDCIITYRDDDNTIGLVVVTSIAGCPQADRCVHILFALDILVRNRL